MNRKNHLLSSFAILSIIFLVSICYNIIFLWCADSTIDRNCLTGSIAIGALLSGIFADKFPRKTILLLILLLSIPAVIVCYKFRSIPTILLCGILLNPLPIIRATLIDNLHSLSKIRLLSLSFAVQFSPLIFTFYVVDLYFNYSLPILISIILLMILIAYLFFYDDEVHQPPKEHGLFHFFQSDHRQKGLFTLLAFIPTQLVFFFANDSLEQSRNNPDLWSMVAIGLTLGAFVSLIYKSTPHVSILTVVYGFSFIFSLLPIIGKTLFGVGYEDPIIQIIIYGSQLGFFIPFVYDVILGSVNKKLRSTACGVMDFIYFITYVSSLIYLDILQIPIFGITIFIPILFLISLVLQKRAEINH